MQEHPGTGANGATDATAHDLTVTESCDSHVSVYSCPVHSALSNNVATLSFRGPYAVPAASPNTVGLLTPTPALWLFAQNPLI